MKFVPTQRKTTSEKENIYIHRDRKERMKEKRGFKKEERCFSKDFIAHRVSIGASI